jgi:hypothetical protein
MILQRIKNDDDEQRPVPAGAAPAQGGAGLQVLLFFFPAKNLNLKMAPNLPSLGRPLFPPRILFE